MLKPQNVDELFAVFLTKHTELSLWPGDMSDEELDRLVEVINRAEDRIHAAEPSPMRAAAALLVAMVSQPPGDLSQTLTEARDRSGLWEGFALNAVVLEALRPLISEPGLIPTCVADLLDHPRRPLVDSFLFHSRKMKFERARLSEPVSLIP